tara:strand:+ start:90 stop:1283 length:1194 start_codon:yes stop_codon:yes gene_type:complete
MSELNIYSDKINKELSPRPHIFDVRRYFIGDSKIMLGSQIKAGIYDVEIPIGGGRSSIDYGTVNDCAKFNMEHPLSNLEIDQSKLNSVKENGAFYLEKYLIITEGTSKDALPLDFKVKNTTSVREFQDFLFNNRVLIDGEKNISDYFGNAVLGDDNTYEGSIGIKFGVRLCYLPPEGFDPFDSQLASQKSDVIAKKNRSYSLLPATINGESIVSSKYSFPIASYEQDVLDEKISFYLDSDENFNQDLKCYIDNLILTKEFKQLMENIIDLRKVPTILMIYSYENLIFSLGLGEGERDSPSDDVVLGDDRRGLIFNDSKKEAWKMFVSYYRNKNKDPNWELPQNDNPYNDFLKGLRDLQINIFNKSEFSLDIRRRLKSSNPFDKDGNECKNDFMKLFS